MNNQNEQTRPTAGQESCAITSGKLLLSRAEAAEQLNISGRKLAELLAVGAIRSVSIGSRRLIPADALCKWVADGCPVATIGGAH